MEKRRFARQTARAPGHIVSRDGDILQACAVRDLSFNGARIGCFRPEAVPDTFCLQLVPSGEIRLAAVKWRSRREVGLEFLAGAEADVLWRLAGGAA
jgi:hypothetical protein